MTDFSATVPDFAATIGRRADYALDGAEVRRMVSPIVYAWVRGETILYCGQSSCGFSRPLAREHHRLRHIAAGDHLLVWTQPDEKHAFRLESMLIRRYQPEFNRPRAKLIEADGVAPPPPLRLLRERFDRLEVEIKAAKDWVQS